MTRIFDAHCHLDQLPEPDEAIRRAEEVGVHRLLAVSEDILSGRKALGLKKKHPGLVLAGLGLHPMYSTTLSPEEIQKSLDFVRDHLKDADVLGEVGLDYKHARTRDEQAYQGELLARMLKMAEESQKSVNLHSRWAQRPTLEAAVGYKRGTGLNALMHWFTASKKLIRICAQEGIYVSVGPSILFGGPSCEVCRCIPDPLLLVETDSPVPFDGTPAEPAWAAEVLQKLSALRGVAAADLAVQCNENFDRYLHPAMEG